MTPRKEKAHATRLLVLETAKAVFAEAGYEAATIRLIAKRSNLSTGAVFAHWDGKASLYREAYGHGPISPEVGRELLDALAAADGLLASEPGPTASELDATAQKVRRAIKLVRP